jgi:serine/threonine protein kinase
MSDELERGFSMGTRLGGKVTVEEFLGEGGQGRVYKADYNGQKKALKWFKKSSLGKDPNAFYENIKQNVMRGKPSDEFLWPIDITQWEDGTFGYVMDLRPKGYYEITEFMLCHVRFKSYRIIINAALHIVSAFRKLHNSGYSYQDLNDGNFFINPENGKVLICDNDNVAPDNTETGIIGKPRYMAPEVVRRKNKPNSLSDRFSMSVILYILFCLNHPLEGKRYLVPALTPAIQEDIYGHHPLFMMDPFDSSNGPHPVGRHIVGGANRTLISAMMPPQWCHTGICRRLSAD